MFFTREKSSGCILNPLLRGGFTCLSETVGVRRIISSAYLFSLVYNIAVNMRSILFAFLANLILNLHSQTPDPFEKLGNLEGEDFVDYVIKNYYQLYSSDFDRTILLTERAKEISIQNGWKERAAYASLYNGVINYLRGNYEAALLSYQYSEHFFDSTDNSKGLARTHNELAVFYHKNDQIEKAIISLDISEREAKKASDLEALGTSLAHRAAFLTRKGKYDEAYPIIQQVFDIRVAQKDSIGLGYVYLDLAEYQLHSGNLEEAQRLIDKSTSIRKVIGDEQGVAVNTVIYGENYFHTGQIERAIPYFQKTIELAGEIGYTDLVRYSYDMLQQAHVKLGNYKKAYESLSRNQVFRDSIFGIEKSKALLELETEYETEKKEQQIALQEAEIAEKEAIISRNGIALLALIISLFLLFLIGLLWRIRVRKRQQLRIKEERIRAREAEINATINSQEKERARFARDLHDGFGQMISILNMNLGSLKNGSKPGERQKVFEESGKVINEMYDELKSICFDLMPQTLIKNGLPSALSEFAERINTGNKVVVVTNFFGLENRLTEIQEISLYRISQEWINNILRHSDADKITIQITRDDEEITLLIEDNGTGFDKTLLTNSTGNGWRNLNTRANLINGEFEIETRKGWKGTTLIVNAPSHVSSGQQRAINTV